MIAAASNKYVVPTMTHDGNIDSRRDDHSVSPTERFESNAHSKYLKNIDKSFKEKDREYDVNSEWRDVSNVLDRLFLVLYLLITVAVSLTLILHVIYKSEL